jgi:hypothetical protein
MASEYQEGFKITERKGELCARFRLATSYEDEVPVAGPNGKEVWKPMETDVIFLNEQQLDDKIKRRTSGGPDMELEMKALQALKTAKAKIKNPTRT